MSSIAFSTLTREQWAKYIWFEDRRYGDRETMVVQGPERTPDEALRAARDFDVVRAHYCQAGAGEISTEE